MLSYYDFQSLVCKSAEQYFDFLTEKQNRGIIDSGRKVISVYQITSGRVPKEYVLTISEKILRPDECEIWIRDKYIPSIEITTTQSLNQFIHTVRITDKDGILEDVENLTANDVKIVSDLRFLIKRLYQFYKRNEFSLYPPPPSDIPPLPDELTADLSGEQLDSVNAVFQSPVTYISGAPGTGKTRAVLARCILRYALDKKRIFLLAPTNNAVEQMLRGVLPVLEDAGIDLNRVYRLGVASESFARDYPQVIGDSELEALLDTLLKQKAHCESEIKNYRNRLGDSTRLAQRLRVCQSAHSHIVKLMPLLKENREHLATVAENLALAIVETEQAKVKYEDSCAQEKTAYSNVTECEANLSSAYTRINKLRRRFFVKKKRRKAEKEIEFFEAYLPSRRAEHSAAVSARKQAYQEWADASESSKRLSDEKSKLTTILDNLIGEISSTAIVDTQYISCIHKSITAQDDSLTFAAELLASMESEYQSHSLQLDEKTYQSYKDELLLIEQQLDNVASSAKMHQKENAFILAGTIDSSLRELTIPDDEEDVKQRRKICHVFLDEAGYTCLAKGMVSFACGAPVTFLGDHKQLPPVCEMDRITPEYSPVCLWALPVAYYSELVDGNFNNLYHRCYCMNYAPLFQGIEYKALNTSYRFGEGLAKVLAKHIYTNQFHGVANTPFEIQIIDAPFLPGPDPRSNRSETDAIRAYLQTNPDLDVAILTPYRNQVKLLRKTLPRDYRDNILTVHRSQGCEWDTIIFSVTDSPNPFFTHSDLPIGRSIINTAVSRAKRRLVIVCDVATWSVKNNQMITELIDEGIRIKQ